MNPGVIDPWSTKSSVMSWRPPSVIVDNVGRLNIVDISYKTPKIYIPHTSTRFVYFTV